MQLFIITAMLAVITSVYALPHPQTSEENEACTRTCFFEEPECGGTLVSISFTFSSHYLLRLLAEAITRLM